MHEKATKYTSPGKARSGKREEAARSVSPFRILSLAETIARVLWSQKTKLVGFILTIAFIVLVAHNVDLVEVRRALASANYAFVLPAAILTLSGYGVRTYRWKRILRPSKDVPTLRLFPVLVIGFATNNILPARVGEIARAYALGRRENVSKTLGLSSVILERLLDGLTLVFFISVLSLFFRLPGWGTDLARAGLLIFLAAALLVLLLLAKEDLALGLWERVLNRLPARLRGRLMGMATSAVLGLQALRDPREVVLVAITSLAVWLAEAGSYYLILRGFGLALIGWQSVFAAVLVLVVVNLGIMVPSAPGYIGAFHFFAVLALGAFSVDRETALGVALVSHAMQYVMITGLGVAFIWQQQF